MGSRDDGLFNYEWIDMLRVLTARIKTVSFSALQSEAGEN